MTSRHSRNTLSGDIPAAPLLPLRDDLFEADEEKAAKSDAVLPNEKRQQNGNIAHAAIDKLPNEVLEEIFCLDRYNSISLSQGLLWKWHRLVHVCRRWRCVIFNVPCTLKLQLFCTYGTPVKKNLGCWPPLPIVLQYLWSPNPSPPPVFEDDVIAALQHPDRICRMQLTVTTLLLEKLSTVAQKQFPVLEYLELVGEPDNEPILPNEFLVGPFPSLQILRVSRVAFPALQRSLPFAKDLVSLRLEALPYLTATGLRNLFPGMTHLEELFLYFHSPISRLISEGYNPAPPCRAVLPALKFVEFCGTSGDLECLLSSTEAPVLQDIDITFFNQATIFNISQFLQFLSRTQTQRSHDSASLHCSESDISVTLTQRMRQHKTTNLRVRCMSLDWQLACMAEICANLSPVVSDVQHLVVNASFPFPSVQDDIDPLPLLELFRPFDNVRTLLLTENVEWYAKHALEQAAAMGVLPNARVISSTQLRILQSLFNVAVEEYKIKTGIDLLAHPLAAQLQNCFSTTAILAVLQGQIQEFDQRRRGGQRLTKWLNPTVNVLYALSATFCEGVGLEFSPAKVIFAGIGVLLLAAKDAHASQDVLVDLFERVEQFFKRLECYTEIRPTEDMTNIIVKIMADVLSILAIATKEVKQGRLKKFARKLLGRTDIEDALTRLDKLTQDEARMAIAGNLKVTHEVEDKNERGD